MSDSAHFLLRYFDRLAETPGGIVKLRALILQLAMQGKFGTQSPTDQNAAELLKKSRAEMARLMSEGVAKKEKTAVLVLDDEQPFSLPSSWAWCRLVDTGQFINGLAFKPSDWSEVGRPIIRIQNLSGRNPEYNRTALNADPSVVVQDGDILVSWSATLETYIWRGEEGVLNQHIFRVLPAPLVDKGYYFWLLKWVIRQLAESEHAHGLAMRHINRGPFLAHPVPLPPLTEQRRIVAKVEELMGLCDALEGAQQEREVVRTRLRTSALHQLASPDTDPKTAAFVLRNLTNLINAPEDLALLRQSIFQLAVSGGLLARVGPWKTARLDSVAECRLGKMLDAHKNTGRPTKYLRNTNVHWFRFELDSIKELKLEVDEFAEYEVHPGDVMICEGGHGIGRTAVWRGDIEGIIFQKALHRVRPKKDLHPDFFSYVMKVFYDTGVLSEFYTGAGIPHLTGQELKKIAIPLPPLAEQRRIVAKVDELMAVLDALEATLTTARTTSEQLLASTIASLSVPNESEEPAFRAAEDAAVYQK